MIGGRYSLGREIGRGGMGAVYLGRDEVLHRQVALKKIGMAPGGSSPDLLRAEREARIAASLNHPHIVGVFDLVDDENHQWLVMEYFAGSTLGDLVRNVGPLDVEALAPIAAQVAEGLAAAHEAGIVHRDVKPSNILVREDGQVKISDFGIARAQADASLTQTGLVTGSPAYLAPEIASGQAATPAADAWSFGATLFHALAGHPPYDIGDNVLGALYRIVNEPPPRLDSAGAMAPLLEATMTRDPADRWSMAEVLRYLHGLEAGTVAGARPGRRAGSAGTTRAPRCSRRRRRSRRPRRIRSPPPRPRPRPPRRPPRRPLPARRRGPRRRPHDAGSRCCPSSSAPSCWRWWWRSCCWSRWTTRSRRRRPIRAAAARPRPAGRPRRRRRSRSRRRPRRTPRRWRSSPPTTSPRPAPTRTPASPSSPPTTRRRAGSYAEFWGKVSDPEILEGPTADPDALTVAYTYRYRYEGETAPRRSPCSWSRPATAS